MSYEWQKKLDEMSEAVKHGNALKTDVASVVARLNQAITAASNPIPKYPNGSDRSDKQPAMIGESGPEIVHGNTTFSMHAGTHNAGARIEIRRSNNHTLIKYGEVQEDGSVFVKGAFDKSLGLGSINHLKNITTGIHIHPVFDYLHKERERRLMKEAREMAEKILYPRSIQESVFNRVRAQYANRWR